MEKQKAKFKKIVSASLLASLITTGAFGLTGCGDSKTDTSDTVKPIESMLENKNFFDTNEEASIQAKIIYEKIPDNYKKNIKNLEEEIYDYICYYNDLYDNPRGTAQKIKNTLDIVANHTGYEDLTTCIVKGKEKDSDFYFKPSWAFPEKSDIRAQLEYFENKFDEVVKSPSKKTSDEILVKDVCFVEDISDSKHKAPVFERPNGEKFYNSFLDSFPSFQEAYTDFALGYCEVIIDYSGQGHKSDFKMNVEGEEVIYDAPTFYYDILRARAGICENELTNLYDDQIFISPHELLMNSALERVENLNKKKNKNTSKKLEYLNLAKNYATMYKCTSDNNTLTFAIKDKQNVRRA